GLMETCRFHRQLAYRRGNLCRRFRRAHLFIIGDEAFMMVQGPGQGIRHMHGETADLQHRCDVRVQGIADHQELLRLQTELGQHTLVGDRIFFRNDFNAAEQRRQAGSGDLAFLMEQIAFGDQDHLIIMGNLGHRFGDALQ
ncbi:MAG: hypothetical protein RIQ43_744, partial [Pseudomonadota bacterium]